MPINVRFRGQSGHDASGIYVGDCRQPEVDKNGVANC